MRYPSTSLRPQRWLLLFVATSVIWGSSFLFIRVAVEHLPPAAVVFGRAVLGAAFLVPLAARRRAFRSVRRVIVPVIVVTVLDMAAPTFLTAWGEQHVSSSAAGILTATDPLFTAALALWLVRSEVPDRKRLAGLIIGFGGVVALLGIDLRGNVTEVLAAGAVLLSALGFAGAALLYRRWLADAPAVAVTALMTAISSVAFLAPAAVDLPRHVPPASSLLALAALGIVNTGVAYWLFYLLVDEAGAATASVITYVMPVVALFLGVGLLGERLTVGAVAGLVLIAAGAWLATSRRAPAADAVHDNGASAPPALWPARVMVRLGYGLPGLWPARVMAPAACRRAPSGLRSCGGESGLAAGAAGQRSAGAEQDGENQRGYHGRGDQQRDERPEPRQPADHDPPATACEGQAELRQHPGEPGIGVVQRVLDQGQGPPFGRCQAHG